MALATQKPNESFIVLCCRCDRPVIVYDQWVARDIGCPHCSSVMKVPPRPADNSPVRAKLPSGGGHRLFRFSCGRCRSLLEAHTGMCHTAGTCPSCGARFEIPGIDPNTGLTPATVEVEDDGENPMPLHAYAASGAQAPRIINLTNGTSLIECPQCRMMSPVDSDACSECKLPFTLDGAQRTRSFDEAALAGALGALLLSLASLGGYFAWPLSLGAVPAILLGWYSYRRFAGVLISTLSIVGITLGFLSIGAAVLGALL